jgi:hypothetical protein
MTASIFDDIRVSCAAVSRHARWVRIDHERLQGYAEVLDLTVRPALEHTAEHHLLHRGDETLGFFLILDSINFGSGYFPFLDKDRGASGYFTVAKRLKEWVESTGLPSPDYLSKITSADCFDVFRQDASNRHADELMELFATALRQLGGWLIEHHESDYVRPFARATTASDLVRSVMRMPFYRDVATYGDMNVPFLKRAQILVQDVVVAEPDHPSLNYPDLSRLTAFADNVLAYVLKADGILSYDPWLEARIQNGELIGAGSFEEIEMRASTIHAIDCLAARINTRQPMTMRELDFHLWNRGQKLKQQLPDLRHRTRCVYY